MSLKTHHSEKYKSVKFAKYKLLDNQINRLGEVMDIMNTRPLGRQNHQNRPYKPYIHRERCHRRYPSYEKRYDRGIGTSREFSYDRNIRGYSSFRGRTKGYNNGRWSYKRQCNCRDRGENRQLKFRSQFIAPARRPRVV